MNLKEQINQIKVKYDSVSTNWDKLTIEQVMKIDEFLNKFINSKPTTEKPSRNTRFIMTDDVFNKITEMRSRNITWSEIAKKFGYLNSGSACNSYGQVKQRRESRLKQYDTETV